MWIIHTHIHTHCANFVQILTICRTKVCENYHFLDDNDEGNDTWSPRQCTIDIFFEQHLIKTIKLEGKLVCMEFLPHFIYQNHAG